MPRKIATIYTLSDPDTKQVRYVGATTVSLHARLCGHILETKQPCPQNKKRRWIQSLLEQGKQPLIEAIDECPCEEAAQAEEEAIARYLLYKCDLTNVRPKYLMGNALERSDDAQASFKGWLRFHAMAKYIRRLGGEANGTALAKAEENGHEIFTLELRKAKELMKKIYPEFCTSSLPHP